MHPLNVEIGAENTVVEPVEIYGPDLSAIIIEEFAGVEYPVNVTVPVPTDPAIALTNQATPTVDASPAGEEKSAISVSEPEDAVVQPLRVPPSREEP